MVESVAYIHSKGVRHLDLRLDQWLVDSELNARLCDFNAYGFDDQLELGLKGKRAIGIEGASYCLPRDTELDNTTESDVFALGSSPYELFTGQPPYKGQRDETIEALFREGRFASTEDVPLGDVITGCWTQKFSSAQDVLAVLWCGPEYGESAPVSESQYVEMSSHSKS